MEDTVFFSEACENAKAAKAACLTYPLYYYYQREASLSKEIRLPHYRQIINIFFQKLLQPNARYDIYLDQTIISSADGS